MLKKANINWNVKQMVKMIDKGSITFDSSVQRGYVWDVNRKSLLIHSIIVGYPIPAFYAAKSENGYSMLDGKQRCKAIKDFLNGNFSLENVPEVETESGFIDVNGCFYENLSDDMQEEINGFSLTVYYFDGISDDEITEMFFRLNNGKPLSAIELTRVKAKSIETIKEIGKHDIFTAALSEKAINKYTNEDITIKTWAILYNENPAIETKYIRPLIETAEITYDQTAEIKSVYTRIFEAVNVLKEKNTKESNRIIKRVLTRTHLISIAKICLKSICDDVSLDIFTKWIEHFFNGDKNATISAIYNEFSGSGSGKPESIKKRLFEVETDYNNFISNNKEENIA